MSVSGEERCPTCGQRVRTFTPDEAEGTSYYVAVAEQDASKLAYTVSMLGEVRLYAEKLRRDRSATVRGLGEDLIGLLDSDA